MVLVEMAVEAEGTTVALWGGCSVSVIVGILIDVTVLLGGIITDVAIRASVKMENTHTHARKNK